MRIKTKVRAGTEGNTHNHNITQERVSAYSQRSNTTRPVAMKITRPVGANAARPADMKIKTKVRAEDMPNNHNATRLHAGTHSNQANAARPVAMKIKTKVRAGEGNPKNHSVVRAGARGAGPR